MGDLNSPEKISKSCPQKETRSKCIDMKSTKVKDAGRQATQNKTKKADVNFNKNFEQLSEQVGGDCDYPTDQIDVSVDEQEERDFLHGLPDEEDLDLMDDEAFESKVDDTVTPVEQPTSGGDREQGTTLQRSDVWSSVQPITAGAGNSTNADVNEFEQLRGNPAFERYLQKRMGEEGAAASAKRGCQVSRPGVTNRGRGVDKTPNKQPKKGTNKQSPLIKSPSDRPYTFLPLEGWGTTMFLLK